MRTRCDKCNKVYDLDDLNADKYELIRDGVRRYYMECPNCNERYTAYYLDRDMLAIQQEMLNLYSQYPLNLKRKNRLMGLQNKIALMHGKLKNEIEGGFA